MSTVKVDKIEGSTGNQFQIPKGIAYSANVSGNVSVSRSLAVGYTDGRVPQANLEVKGNVVIGDTTAIAGHASVGTAGVTDATRALTVVGASDGSGSSIIVGYNSSLASKFSVRDDGLTTIGDSLVFTTASKGVYLGVTSATAANLLDDYEEGTFTPSVGGNASYTTQVGHYTKIGNSVTILCELHINTLGTGSASTITGIPFAAVSEAALAMAKSTNLSGSYVEVNARISGTTIYYMTRTAASTTQGTNTGIHADGTLVQMCGSYIAA